MTLGDTRMTVGIQGMVDILTVDAMISAVGCCA